MARGALRGAVAAAVLACVGCRGPARCPAVRAVAARFLDLARADLDHAGVDDATRRDVTEQLPAMRDTLAQACADGHWTAAVRNCLVGADDHVASRRASNN